MGAIISQSAILAAVPKPGLGLVARFLTRSGLLTSRANLPLNDRLDDIKILVAGARAQQVRSGAVAADLRDVEFRVFSQFGDDGIIQYLLAQVSVDRPVFVEIGVENYVEANTRFLLVHDNWRGLVVDGSVENTDYVRRDSIYWRHDLTAVHAFVDRDNINDLLRTNHFTGSIGLLSIDIDGNDYWVWDAISVIAPAIVVVEYNALFGRERAVTVPYDPTFARGRAHPSHLYWGCSLRALCLLGERKGYAFAGCNSAGNNAYFVRKDRLGSLPSQTAATGFVASRFRESRGVDGQLSFVGGLKRVSLIADMPVHDIDSGEICRVDEVVGDYSGELAPEESR